MKEKLMLITGGLGQIGMGIAEKAISNGYKVTLVGKSRIEKKAKFYSDFVQRENVSYVSLDIYDSGSSDSLLKIAKINSIWVNTSEPYNENDTKSNWKTNAKNLFSLAINAGYTTDSPEGKKMLRIGSPPVEVWEDEAFSSNSFKGWPENTDFDFSKNSKISGNDPYFQNKLNFKNAADEALRNKLALITVAPSLVIGPYSNHGDEYELWPQIIKRKAPFNIAYPSDKTSIVTLDNLSLGIMAAIEKGKIGETYQLSDRYIGLDKLMRLYLQSAIDMGLASKGRIPSSIPMRNPIPNITYAWAKLNKGVFDKMKISTPTWMKPELIAIQIMIGKRSSLKASQELGFVPGNLKDLEKSVVDSIAFYKKIDLV